MDLFLDILSLSFAGFPLVHDLVLLLAEGFSLRRWAGGPVKETYRGRRGECQPQKGCGQARGGPPGPGGALGHDGMRDIRRLQSQGSSGGQTVEALRGDQALASREHPASRGSPRSRGGECRTLGGPLHP
jgi:hypothetical protein